MSNTCLPASGIVASGPTPRPRDAGSLVLYRKRGEHFEVLVGRRSSRARFKPGVYVFPGGGLEPADHLVTPLRSLNGKHTEALGCSRPRGDAIALAAVRETFEETGLMLGERGDIGAVMHDGWQAFRARHVAPDLARLDFLERAITLTYRRTRFHARFFATSVEFACGELRSNGELEDFVWVQTDEMARLETTIIQTAIIEVLHQRLHGTDAPAKRLFHKWGRHNFIDIL